VKKWSICAILAAVLLIVPEAVFAAKSEPPAGICSQEPSGDFAYKGDSLEVKEAKIEILWALPNPYFMVAPMNFKGVRNEQFILNSETFRAIFPFMTRLRFDQQDTVLYHGLSFFKKATAGIFNIDLGLGAKIIRFNAIIDSQPDTGINAAKSLTIAVPMVYVGFSSP
jgi:hypothetical protein